MIDGISDPGFRALLAPPWNRVKSPGALAAGDLVGIHKAARALFAARDAGKHQVPNHQGSSGRTIALVCIRHDHIPKSRSGLTIQRQQMRVVRDHEDAIARNSHTAVGASAGFAQ